MTNQRETVTINGRSYDKHTGMPIVNHEPATKTAAHSGHKSKDIHVKTQRSKTLSRNYVKKPAHISAKKIAISDGIKAYPSISKFASHPADRPTPVIKDIAPGVHPMVQRAEAKRAANTSKKAAVVVDRAKPSQVLKQEAISNALAKADNDKATTKRHRAKNKSSAKRSKSNKLSLATGGLAVLLIGAYFTYVSMPSLSVKVAAAQSGVNASYPAYRPSGFSLSGAVAYSPGSVSMKFTQNGGSPDNFTLTQSNSGWDSSALLDNYVSPKAGKNYLTTQDSGLTIYTFDKNAAWVSGGTLYTITGDTLLSTDQVQKIATSL